MCNAHTHTYTQTHTHTHTLELTGRCEQNLSHLFYPGDIESRGFDNATFSVFFGTVHKMS